MILTNVQVSFYVLYYWRILHLRAMNAIMLVVRSGNSLNSSVACMFSPSAAAFSF